MFYDPNKRRRVSVDFTNDPGKTEQCHKKDCDIRVIMRKAERQGVLEHVNRYKGQYMDLPDVPSFHEAMNIIATADQMFETVPSHIRKKFGNDPAEYLKFMQNPENRDAIEALGLDASHLPKPVEPDPLPPAEPPAEG